MKNRALGLGVLLALAVAGCSKPPVDDRATRVLDLAAQEAANIPQRMDRFARQLNIADTQVRRGQSESARKTLALVQETLVGAKKEEFDDFHRIAAWTSISQIARRAGDKGMATKAADNALATLNDVDPVEQRPQYVASLSEELDALRGHAAAIELLNTGASWAAQLSDANVRRFALYTFADRLIQLDGYDNAKTALEHDPDAAWRTDALMALADQAQGIQEPRFAAVAANAEAAPAAPGRGGGAGGFSGGGGGGGFGGATGGRGGRMSAVPSVQGFNKDVHFENVYKQQ